MKKRLVSVNDPFALFASWYEEACSANAIKSFEPNAMTLATAGRDGSVSARIVLMKEFDSKGFIFFTNYQSRKAHQILENARIAATFYWPYLGKQVRIEGHAGKTSTEESDLYFSSRPRKSRLGAIVSRQSSTLSSREELISALKRAESLHKGEKIPRPDHWGGFRIIPERIEFWQAGPYRLHDRLEFSRKGASWEVKRLYP